MSCHDHQQFCNHAHNNNNNNQWTLLLYPLASYLTTLVWLCWEGDLTWLLLRGLCSMCSLSLLHKLFHLPSTGFWILIHQAAANAAQLVIAQVIGKPAEGYHARPLSTWFKECFCPPICWPYTVGQGDGELHTATAKSSSVSLADWEPRVTPVGARIDSPEKCFHVPCKDTSVVSC